MFDQYIVVNQFQASGLRFNISYIFAGAVAPQLLIKTKRLQYGKKEAGGDAYDIQKAVERFHFSLEKNKDKETNNLVIPLKSRKTVLISPLIPTGIPYGDKKFQVGFAVAKRSNLSSIVLTSIKNLRLTFIINKERNRCPYKCNVVLRSLWSVA